MSERFNEVLQDHAARIAIFLFTLLIGMTVSVSMANAQKRTTAPSASPTVAPAKAPVPLLLGIVTQSSDTQVGLTDEVGATHTISIATTTRLEVPGLKTKPTIKNITVNDMVAVASEEGNPARLVAIVPKTITSANKKVQFLGVVSSREATNSGVVLSLKHPKADQFDKSLVTTNAKIIAKGMDKPVADDIKAGDKVLVIGTRNAQNVIAASKIYLIPGKARGLLDKLSPLPQVSVSGQPKASGAASPKTP